MHCLMKAHDMVEVVGPRPVTSMEIYNKITKYDSLLQGWFLGSLNEEILGIVVDCDSAKEVWDTLKSYFDPPIISQQDSGLITREDTKTETKDQGTEATSVDTKEIDELVSTKKATEAILDIRNEDKYTDSGKSKAKWHHTTQTGTKDSDRKKEKKKIEDAETKNEKSDWRLALLQLLSNNNEITTEQINENATNALHIAVGQRRNHVIGTVLPRIRGELASIRNAEGSTLLHVAANVDNTYAARLLTSKDIKLLETKDNKNKTPLHIALDNMHLETIDCLLKAAEDERNRIELSDNDKVPTDPLLPHVQIGADVLVNAISAKNFSFAEMLITRNHKYATCDDSVLMATTRTFPNELDYVETLIYPHWDILREAIVNRRRKLYNVLVEVSFPMLKDIISTILECGSYRDVVLGCVVLIFFVPSAMVYVIYRLIALLLLMVYYPFSLLYHLLWKVASRVVPTIRNVEQKKKEYDEANKILQLICRKIKEHNHKKSYRSFFERPFLEAARHNASEVIDEIMKIWPKAIRCVDGYGYDIIQLATIHRSEKIYNLIYSLGDHKGIYRTIKDSSYNNMLHLAGRLAPSNKLKLRTGAAFQLQRELQWREEVKKLVYPSCVTSVNIFNETPEMVFTKEHANLVKEGEAWIKTVAESCSITATLITTIVFAAAITVPGGSRQETGTPVFLKEAAFLVFAISDAISLFSAMTALLLFLSILTARFAEEDFLFLLPKRLIIGLCTLLISEAAMMVAFGANLFLVFCRDKMWMLVPICGLAFLPIAIFFILQVPLIIDLIRSTYVSVFGIGNQKNRHLDPSDMWFFFSK